MPCALSSHVPGTSMNEVPSAAAAPCASAMRTTGRWLAMMPGPFTTTRVPPDSTPQSGNTDDTNPGGANTSRWWVLARSPFIMSVASHSTPDRMRGVSKVASVPDTFVSLTTFLYCFASTKCGVPCSSIHAWVMSSSTDERISSSFNTRGRPSPGASSSPRITPIMCASCFTDRSRSATALSGASGSSLASTRRSPDPSVRLNTVNSNRSSPTSTSAVVITSPSSSPALPLSEARPSDRADRRGLARGDDRHIVRPVSSMAAFPWCWSKPQPRTVIVDTSFNGTTSGSRGWKPTKWNRLPVELKS